MNLTKALAPLAGLQCDEAAHMHLHSRGTEQVFSHTDSRKQNEPSKKQQDGNLYPPVAVATPIRHREASRVRENMENGMRVGMQNRGVG